MAHDCARPLELHRQPFYPALSPLQLRKRALFSRHFAASSALLKQAKPPRDAPAAALPSSFASALAAFSFEEGASAPTQPPAAAAAAAASLQQPLRVFHPLRDAAKLRGRVRPNGVQFNSSGSRLLVASRDSVLLLHAYNVASENQVNSPGVALVLSHGSHPDVLAIAGQEAPKQPPYLRVFDVRVPFSGKSASGSPARDVPVLEFWGPHEETWWTGCWRRQNDQIVCIDRKDVLHVFDLPAAVRTPHRTAISIPTAQQVVGVPPRPAAAAATASSGAAPGPTAPRKAVPPPASVVGAGCSGAATTQSSPPAAAGGRASSPASASSACSASSRISTRTLAGVTNAATFSAAGDLLLLAQDDGALRVFPSDPLLPLAEEPFTLSALHPGGVTCLAADPTHAFVAAGGNEQLVSLLDAQSLAVIGALGRTEGPVQALGFSCDGRLLGWGCREQGAGLQAGLSGRDAANAEAAASPSPDGQRAETFLTIAGTDPCEIYFQYPTSAPVASLAFHPSRYICAFATDADPVASQSAPQGSPRGTGATYWSKTSGAAGGVSPHPLGILTFE
ncbi:hypothetical protein BESB_012410 [Besnoitia besnoiti]|uniref:WD domain, G-beta repeat-containing protein n=1 Tax=Besnoitia besnoiti TaxID=94643 RepID=A0A2A9M3V9_BESBE|nr:hypothetical protein BESB_012410 [Besnoitia besnoiti]PFH32629.1 hypothetical protein BESB_012410 [Besnoitia besnoiti]